MKDWQSLSHVRWECKYHVVITPKCRGQVLNVLSNLYDTSSISISYAAHISCRAFLNTLFQSLSISRAMNGSMRAPRQFREAARMVA